MAPDMRLLLLGAAIGFLAYAFRKPLRGEPVDDDVLVTRVRLALDKLLEQPGSVNIEVREGRVTLTGPAAQPELRAVTRALRALPGVRHVDCRLSAHAA
jgi:osmotically-inducible protein OsmY